MVQDVVDLPAELHVTALTEAELLGERGIRVPEARSAQTRQVKTRRTVLPVARIGGGGVLPERLIGSVRRQESVGIDPVVDQIRFGPAMAERRVAHEVRPAGDGIAGTRNLERGATLGVEVARQDPAA